MNIAYVCLWMCYCEDGFKELLKKEKRAKDRKWVEPPVVFDNFERKKDVHDDKISSFSIASLHYYRCSIGPMKPVPSFQ